MFQDAFKLQFPQNADSNISHRALNYIEDIYRYLENRQLGTIEDIDNYLGGEFYVKLESKRCLGEVKKEIKRQLIKHNLTDICKIQLCRKTSR